MNTHLVDLHMHSRASDGSQTPAQLLEVLRRAGIRTFSLTDHDTDAGVRELERLPLEGLRFIRGIEFSCVTTCGKCHILGYDYDPDHPRFRAALAYGAGLRQEKLQQRLRFLEERFSIVLTDEEQNWLHRQNSPGKPHLGQILVNRGLAPDLSTAIKTYVNPAKGGQDRIPAAMAIDAILAAGGIPVWAHPLGGEGERRLRPEEFEALLRVLLQAGIRGLECHYSRYGKEETDLLLKKAEESGLLVSGGSDYHGTVKPDLLPGMLNREHRPVEESALTVLLARAASRR